MAEIRRHCDRPTPDTVGLGVVRLRLSQASAARTRYVRDEVMPVLRQGADAVLTRELDAMQRAFAAKRLASSEHVTTWSTGTIAQDWNGYRSAARQILAMMEEQMEREIHLLALRAPSSGISPPDNLAHGPDATSPSQIQNRPGGGFRALGGGAAVR